MGIGRCRGGLARLVGGLLLAVLPAPRAALAAGVVGNVPVVIGRAVVPLNGPWKFHPGDDGAWAAPGFDDTGWESVDLTPPAGAHDDDVGLSGYVPGWNARGHRGWRGFAWYRLRLAVTAPAGAALALAGPPAVDSVYQLFVDGRLLGGCGDFSRRQPVAYSVQPRLFAVPGRATGASRPVVVALRVWMDAAAFAAADGGGVHIAPALGEAAAAEARYRLQWLETVCGYAVDAVEPVVFALLALAAAALWAPARRDLAWPWLIAALLLTALLRANQAVYFWGRFESLRVFGLVRHVLLEPLVAGVWILAWRAWFGLGRPAWLAPAAGATTAVYVAAQFLTSAWLGAPLAAPVRTGLGTVTTVARLGLAALLVIVAWEGGRRRHRGRWLALLAVALVATGLFAPELSQLGVPGIWFPWGVGVSRTQYAYAALAVVLGALFWQRLRAALGPGSAAAPRLMGGAAPAG